MGQFKESLKEELKEELGDLVYEKAKAEIKTKIKDSYRSRMDRFLAFFGIRRNHEELDKISEKIQEKDEPFMTQSLVGVMELFSMKYVGTAIDVSTSLLSDHQDKIDLSNSLELLAEKEDEPKSEE